MRLTFLVVAALVALMMSNVCAARPPVHPGSAAELAGFALAYERVRTSGWRGTAADAEDAAYFRGFVAGVFLSQKWPCAREAIDGEQAEVVVAKYLRENPERWATPAQNLVVEAGDRVWGCKREQAPQR
jgi:hypothetical protein